MSEKRRKASMGNLMVTFVVMIFALCLTPLIQLSVNRVTGTGPGNLTGSAALALARLIPLFWCIIIVAVGVAAVYVQLKDSDW